MVFSLNKKELEKQETEWWWWLVVVHSFIDMEKGINQLQWFDLLNTKYRNIGKINSFFFCPAAKKHAHISTSHLIHLLIQWKRKRLMIFITLHNHHQQEGDDENLNFKFLIQNKSVLFLQNHSKQFTVIFIGEYFPWNHQTSDTYIYFIQINTDDDLMVVAASNTINNNNNNNKPDTYVHAHVGKFPMFFFIDIQKLYLMHTLRNATILEYYNIHHDQYASIDYSCQTTNYNHHRFIWWIIWWLTQQQERRLGTNFVFTI